jgi:hypothetical protein
MASLDKTSVRAEVSRLKTDFEQLCADGKITAESKALMILKKSVEFTSAKNIQHKLDNPIGAIGTI